MFILSQKSRNFVNSDNVTCFYVTKNLYDVKVNFINGSGCLLAEFNEPIADKVIEKIAEEIAKGTKAFKIPKEDYFINEHDGNKVHWHHATGKKLKRHGGS